MKKPAGGKRKLTVTRVRTAIKTHLGWMEGFPIATRDGVIRWMTPSGEQSVTGETLSRSKRALHELLREPGTLEHALGDREVASWQKAVSTVLGALSAPIHRDTSVPGLGDPALAPLYSERTSRRARALASAHPSLTPLLDALVWTFALSPDDFSKALSILERAPERATALDGDLATIVIAMKLAIQEGPEKVEPLLALLTDPRADTIPTSGLAAAKQVQHRLLYPRAQDPVQRPEPSLGKWLKRLTRDLFDANDAGRRVALELIARLDLPEQIGAWETFWRELDALQREVESYRHRVRRPETATDAPPALVERASRLVASTPRPVEGRALATLVVWYAARPPIFSRAARTALELVDRGERAHFFASSWMRIDQDDGPERALAVIDALTRYLRTSASGDARFSPWASVIAKWRESKLYYWFERELVSTPGSDVKDEGPRARLGAFYESLAHCLMTEPRAAANDDVVDWLVELASVPLPVETKVAIARLAQNEPFASMNVWTLGRVIELAEGDIEVVKRLLLANHPLVDSSELQTAYEAALSIARSGRRALAQALMLHGFATRLGRAGSTLAALGKRAGRGRTKVHLALPAITESRRSPEWIAQYPESLHVALRDLADVDENAERTADRILGESYPRAAALEEEIARAGARLRTLEGRARERLATRIENLRGRVHATPRVSAARLGRLRKKLEHAARSALVSTIERLAEDRIREFLHDALGATALPGEFLAPTYQPFFAAITELTPAMRALAVRVLQRRASAPPWDFRDAPENRAFIERMEGRGIRMAPWVDGGERATKLTSKTGTDVWLRLEDDPLEIMRMGAHFETCLSPFGANYFSVFANIADINKRVVYARDAEGRIIGRVLLALTDQGSILTFHPYAHADIGWAELIKTFVTALAAAMGTSVVPSGRVSRLIAPDWYDDGPRDLTGQFELLKQATLDELEATSPADFLATLDRKLAPLGLNEVTFPIVLGLPGLAKAPALVEALFARASAFAREVHPAVLVTACRLARESDQPTLVQPVMVERIAGYVRLMMREHRWFFADGVQAIVESHPSLALALLRETRGRGVRRLEDETEPSRLELAAIAHERLLRPAQALALYRRGADSPVNDEARARCRKRLGRAA